MNRFCAIVGIKKNECIIVDTKLVQLVKQSSNQYIQLKNKISPGTCPGLATKFFCRQHGSMGDLC